MKDDAIARLCALLDVVNMRRAEDGRRHRRDRHRAHGAATHVAAGDHAAVSSLLDRFDRVQVGLPRVRIMSASDELIKAHLVINAALLDFRHPIAPLDGEAERRSTRTEDENTRVEIGEPFGAQVEAAA